MNAAQGAIVGGDAEEVYVSIGIVSFVPEGSLPTWPSCPGHLHTCSHIILLPADQVPGKMAFIAASWEWV